MRSDSFNFFASNVQAAKDSRFVIEVSFDSANSVLRYFGSHDDCDYPASATVYDGLITDFSSTTQKLDPISGNSTIGDISFSLLDDGSDVTELLSAQLASSRSLRSNRVRVYAGYKGLAWADYTLLTTQFIDDYVSYRDGEYTISCSDIQRETRTKIFKPYETNLNAALTKTDTSLTVVSNAHFTMVAHDSSYSVNASATVGYLKIYKSSDEYEIVSYTGTSSTTGFTGLTRALFGTKALDITIDSALATDRRPKVEEYIYLEGPVPKLIYALRTGVLYDQGGATLPDHWHVGTSTTYVRLADFTGYGADWWDTSDPTKGFKARFQGLTEQDGKQFIERELQLLLGAFGPIYSDGAVGLKKMARVLSNSGAVAHLTASNVVAYTDLKHDYKRLHNDIEIHWNYDAVAKKYTRINEFIDTDSQTIYGTSDKYVIKFQGLIGDIHTTSMLLNQFAAIRDRYAGPPLELSLDVLPSLNPLEVGDVVRVTLDEIRDYTGSATTIDRTFEIQSIRINWITGSVSLDLFGSSKLAQWVPLDTTTGSFIASGYYTGTGTNMTSALTISGGAVTANGSLTGNDDATNSGAIYYYNGDLTINSGVTVTTTKNVFLKINGYLTINGTLTSAGGGPAGTSGSVAFADASTWDGTAGTATAGMVGSTFSGGGVTRYGGGSGTGFNPLYNGFTPIPGTVTVGAIPAVNNIYYESSTIKGLPTELRGVSGGCGGAVIISSTSTAAGGAGGAGGGGIMILCRGLGFGANGKIITSGATGSTGSTLTTSNTAITSGSGAGGAPGYLLVLIDGNNITYPSITSATHVAANGGTTLFATPLDKFTYQDTATHWYQSGYIGSTIYGAGEYSAPDASGKWHQVVYVTNAQSAVADPKLIADVPTSVGTSTATNTPQTPAENLATITVTVTPPSDGNYLYSNVYYRVTGTTPWTLAGPANNQRTIVAAMDGTQYDIEARSVSRLGGESPSGARTTVTVSSGTGGVTLASGNYLRTNDNVGDGSASGYGVSFSVAGVKGYKASDSTPTFTLDAADGSFTFGQISTDKYLDFDASTGDITMGRDTRLLGTDAYNNDNIYWSWDGESIDGFYTSTTGSGAVVLSASSAINVDVSASSGDVARFEKRTYHPSITWDKNTRLKFEFELDGSPGSNTTINIGWGDPNTTNGRYLLFRIKPSSSAVYGVTGNGSSETETSLSTTLTSSAYYKFEIVFTAATNAKFYINDSLKATISTTLPSGSASTAANLLACKMSNSAASSATGFSVLTPMKFLQDP